MRSHACDVANKFTNWLSISVKKCSTCDAKDAANWASHAILWVILLSTSLSQLITNRSLLLCMIFSMHYCCSDARYMLLSRRLTQRRLMFSLRRSKSRRRFESKSSRLTFERNERWHFIINRSSQNLKCVKFKRFRQISWRFTLLLTFLKIISLCRRCLCFRVRRSIRVRRVENILRRVKKMTRTAAAMMKRTAMRMKKTMRMMRATKRRRSVKTKMRRTSKKIKISSRTNRLSRSRRRKSSRRMSREATSSSWVKAKRKTKRSRNRTKIMRMKSVSHSVISLAIRSMRRKALNLRRRSVKSSIRRRRDQNLRSILVEVRVCRFVCSKRVSSRSLMKTLIRLKKKNDRFRTKTTLTRRQNVVVVSIFNRFCMIIF